jgi:TonB family protein
VRTVAKATKTNPRAKHDAEAEAAAQKAAQAAQAAQAARVGAIAESLATGLSSNGGLSAKDLTGFGPGAGSANYLQAVLGAYDAAWFPPNEVEDESSIVTAKIVVNRSGHIISATIRKRSNIRTLDSSVQRALDAVKSLPPFPEGAKDLERTIDIKFDLKAKRAAA